jgi:adenylate cyclase
MRATSVNAALVRISSYWADLAEANAAVDRLAAIPGHEWVARDIMALRLRTLLAGARGDEAGYRQLRDRYRAVATPLGFEGHIQWAESMP